MELLIKSLEQGIAKLRKAQNNPTLLNEDILNTLYSVFPFNKFEYIISHLIDGKIISLAEYLSIRNEYLARNKFLYVYEITAPRSFGEKWAQQHLNEIVQDLQRPSKIYDENYGGQYDFWYDNIRIEVKASRAVKRGSDEPLILKALSSGSKSGFDMNFQQIKPSCCDVFVWIAVWTDKIRYWVLSSKEVASNKHYSFGQHRGNTGEGQLWITEKNIDEFSQYEVAGRDILNKIKEKAQK